MFTTITASTSNDNFSPVKCLFHNQTTVRISGVCGPIRGTASAVLKTMSHSCNICMLCDLDQRCDLDKGWVQSSMQFIHKTCPACTLTPFTLHIFFYCSLDNKPEKKIHDPALFLLFYKNFSSSGEIKSHLNFSCMAFTWPKTQ